MNAIHNRDICNIKTTENEYNIHQNILIGFYNRDWMQYKTEIKFVVYNREWMQYTTEVECNLQQRMNAIHNRDICNIKTKERIQYTPKHIEWLLQQRWNAI